MSKQKTLVGFLWNLVLCVVMSKKARKIYYYKKEQKSKEALRKARTIETIDGFEKVKGDPLPADACTLVEEAVRAANHESAVKDAMDVYKQKQKLLSKISNGDRQKINSIAAKVMGEALESAQQGNSSKQKSA